ncbi:MAG TPA: TlpA disulfide reductase family protein [Phycisphaerae bacterium]|nr:TlpA disulfide reductase family protein [Phycisphaerae bacterium]
MSRYAFFFLVLAALIVGCSEPAPDPAAPAARPPNEAPAAPAPVTDPAAAPADPAPAAPEIGAAYWLNSEPLTLASLRGKTVVVEFWATWCPPCRKSIPHLIELHKTYAPKGVVFIGLTSEPREAVERFVKEMGMPYAIGGGSRSAVPYGVRGIPHAVVIDPSGAMTWKGHPMAGLDEALKARMARTPAK